MSDQEQPKQEGVAFIGDYRFRYSTLDDLKSQLLKHFSEEEVQGILQSFRVVNELKRKR